MRDLLSRTTIEAEDWRKTGNIYPIKFAEEVWYNKEKDLFGYRHTEHIVRNYSSGKTGTFWRTTHAVSVRKTKAGYYLKKQFDPKKKTIHTFRVFDIYGLPMALVGQPEFKEWFSMPSFKESSLLSYYAAPESPWKASLLLPHLLTCETVPEFVASTFGKTRVRKDLVKAVAKATLREIEVAYLARGTMPVDWIVSSLNKANENEGRSRYYRSVSSSAHRGLRSAFKVARPKTKKDILDDIVTNDIHRWQRWAIDISNGSDIINEIPPERLQSKEVKTLRDIHDVIYENYSSRKAAQMPEVKGKIAGFKKELHDLKINDMKIVVATSSYDLLDWGDEMRNCIGGYGSYVKGNEKILAAVFEGPKLIANMEINYNQDEWKLNQLLGKCNQALPENPRNSIIQELRNRNVDTSNYWGDQRVHVY